jgi:hypothetical protein
MQGRGIAGGHIREGRIRADIIGDPPGAGAFAAIGQIRNHGNSADILQPECVLRSGSGFDPQSRGNADFRKVTISDGFDQGRIGDVHDRRGFQRRADALFAALDSSAPVTPGARCGFSSTWPPAYHRANSPESPGTARDAPKEHRVFRLSQASSMVKGSIGASQVTRQSNMVRITCSDAFGAGSKAHRNRARPCGHRNKTPKVRCWRNRSARG